MGLITSSIFPNGGERGSGGGIVQVVSVVDHNTRTYNINNTKHTTNLQASITPSDSSNKILIMYSVNQGGTGNYGGVYYGLVRGSTELVTASNTDGFGAINPSGVSNGAHQSHNFPITYVDSPNTTSSTTYKVQIFGVSGCGNHYFNRAQNYSNGGKSHLILMEFCS